MAQYDKRSQAPTLSEAERGKQVQRIQTLLQEADRAVWQQDVFPAAHRPNIPTLINHVVVVDILSPAPFITHQGQKPATLRAAKKVLEINDQDFDKNKVALYEPYTRELKFSTAAVSLPDGNLRRFSYHEAATDTLSRPTRIPMEILSVTTRDFIRRVLQINFRGAGNLRKRQAKIEVEKLGYRKVLMVDGNAVCDLYTMFPIVDEVYPTMVEILTEQTLIREGNIAQMEEDARTFHMKPTEFEDHRKFFYQLVFLMRQGKQGGLDWRILLDAFKTGDPYETLSILKSEVGSIEQARNIVEGLLSAMASDEHLIDRGNTLLKEFGLI